MVSGILVFQLVLLKWENRILFASILQLNSNIMYIYFLSDVLWGRDPNLYVMLFNFTVLYHTGYEAMHVVNQIRWNQI